MCIKNVYNACCAARILVYSFLGPNFLLINLPAASTNIRPVVLRLVSTQASHLVTVRPALWLRMMLPALWLRMMPMAPVKISWCHRRMIYMNRISLPNEITPLPTNMHSLHIFSIFAQTPPFFAQTPLIFAQPSTCARPPAAPWISGSWTHLFRWKEIDVLFTIAVSLSCHREHNWWQLIT